MITKFPDASCWLLRYHSEKVQGPLKLFDIFQNCTFSLNSFWLNPKLLEWEFLHFLFTEIDFTKNWWNYFCWVCFLDPVDTRLQMIGGSINTPIRTFEIHFFCIMICHHRLPLSIHEHVTKNPFHFEYSVPNLNIALFKSNMSLIFEF